MFTNPRVNIILSNTMYNKNNILAMKQTIYEFKNIL